MHLFDTGPDLVKYTWSRTGVRILDQVRQALDERKYPLFVAEGASRDKLTKIMHSAYLHKALRSFSAVTGSLFIYGHSLAENDEHILRLIEKGTLRDVFVSLYGDHTNPANRKIISRARRMTDAREKSKGRNRLDVHFFDADSTDMWKCAV
ncbi:MAG: DUF4917 family protein [Magnetococcales bacterium]|nr:DUF4917 family protein [Magnetococcales bacterium]